MAFAVNTKAILAEEWVCFVALAQESGEEMA